MSEIKKFTREETEQIVGKIKLYFSNELDQEIGAFDAEFLIDFFSKEIGAHYYNQGLTEAMNLFTDRAEELTYLIQELEKPLS